MSRRVVITGMGIVSSIGNDVEEVKNSLIKQRSGIVEDNIYKEMCSIYLYMYRIDSYENSDNIIDVITFPM